MSIVNKNPQEVIDMFHLAAEHCVGCDRQRGGRFTRVPLAEALEASKTREILVPVQEKLMGIIGFA